MTPAQRGAVTRAANKARKKQIEAEAERRKRIGLFLIQLDTIEASGGTGDGAGARMTEGDAGRVAEAVIAVGLTADDFRSLDEKPALYNFGQYPESFWKLRQVRNHFGRILFDAIEKVEDRSR